MSALGVHASLPPQATDTDFISAPSSDGHRFRLSPFAARFLNKAHRQSNRWLTASNLEEEEEEEEEFT